MRVLFVSENTPEPALNGGAQRTQLLIRALQACSEVDFLLVDRAGLSTERLDLLRTHYNLVEHVRVLQSRLADHARHLAPVLGGLRRFYQPDPVIASAAQRLIDRRGYDVVVGRYLRVAANAGLLQLPRLVLDLDDHDVALYATRAAVRTASMQRRAMAAVAERQLRKVVPPLLRQCTHVWVTNAADLDTVRPVPASVVPNVPLHTSPEPLPFHSGGVVLLVASMDYDVNARAADRFIRYVWPRIIAERPGAQLRIVGSGLSGARSAVWAAVPGVTVVGRVDDLAAEYARSAFAVAPVEEGGGTKIKVLEALGHGRTVVVTPHAHRGLENTLPEGQAVSCAADESEFVGACVTLLERPDVASSRGATGHALIRRHFSRDAVMHSVARSVRDVAGATLQSVAGSQ